eukprot:9362873-Ditylum_brightwellii.AAC.2
MEIQKERLAEHGYYPVQHTPGLWRHKWRPVQFALVVDDFRVKIKGDEHGEHLLKSLQQHYEVIVDKEGNFVCGIHLDWDYQNKRVDLAMPRYIDKARLKYGHQKPKRAQHAPHKHSPVHYGAKT